MNLLGIFGFAQGEAIRACTLVGGMAFVVRHRTWLLAFWLSCLFHAVLLWGLGSEALRGGAFVRERSSATVVQFLQVLPQRIMPRGGARVSVGEGNSEHSSQSPGASLRAPESSAEVVGSPRDANQSAAERLASDVTAKLGGPLPELHYFAPEELSVKPQLLSDAGSAEPTFIPDIVPLPVLVQLLINEQGGVDKVVLGENFLSDIARKYIVESFSGMKFSPGMLGALPVKSQLRLVVDLDPTVPVN